MQFVDGDYVLYLELYSIVHFKQGFKRYDAKEDSAYTVSFVNIC